MNLLRKAVYSITAHFSLDFTILNVHCAIKTTLNDNSSISVAQLMQEINRVFDRPKEEWALFEEEKNYARVLAHPMLDDVVECCSL